MQVDSANLQQPKLQKLTPEERAKLAKEGRCFRCRKQGHVSRDCPEKNKTPTTQNSAPSRENWKARKVETTAKIEEIPEEEDVDALLAKVCALKGKKNEKFYEELMKDDTPKERKVVDNTEEDF